MQRFANPTRFLRLQRAVLPWVSAATVICFAAGLYLALFAAPQDYQQGETVRIMAAMRRLPDMMKTIRDLKKQLSGDGPAG